MSSIGYLSIGYWVSLGLDFPLVWGIYLLGIGYWVSNIVTMKTSRELAVNKDSHRQLSARLEQRLQTTTEDSYLWCPWSSCPHWTTNMHDCSLVGRLHFSHKRSTQTLYSCSGHDLQVDQNQLLKQWGAYGGIVEVLIIRESIGYFIWQLPCTRNIMRLQLCAQIQKGRSLFQYLISELCKPNSIYMVKKTASFSRLQTVLHLHLNS